VYDRHIVWLSDIYSTVFNGKDVCWCLSELIVGILCEIDATNQVMLYGLLNYSRFIDCQKCDFALFKLSKCTNLDIIDAACLHIAHNLQHLTSRRTTKPTQTWIVNARKRTFCHFCCVHTANRHSGPPTYVIKPMKASPACRQKVSKLLWHSAACNSKRSLKPRNNETCAS
jgi:hypothetical protein